MAFGRRKRKRKRKGPPQPWHPPQRKRAGLQLYRAIPRRLGFREMISPVRQIESRAFARGAGGSKLFGDLFLLVITARAARRAIKRRPQTLAFDKLAPGESISVRTAKPPKGGMTTAQRQQGLPG
jgi:hypothetical protein